MITKPIVALTLGLSASILFSTPSLGALIIRQSGTPVGDTDGVIGISDTDTTDFTAVEYDIFTDSNISVGVIDIDIDDSSEVLSISPQNLVIASLTPANSVIGTFTVNTGDLGIIPDNDAADFTVSVTGLGVGILDPISGDVLIGGSVPVDLQTIPEPLTILGSFTALGFAGFLKKHQSKK